MNYKNIVNNIGKYHYVLVVKKKAGILGSDNNSSVAKKSALKKILSSQNKYEGLYVIKLTIKTISKKIIKENKESKINIIGGPLEVTIEFNEIENNKMVKLEDYKKNNKLYITEKYLKKNNIINEKIIKLIASSAHNNRLSTKLFDINTIDKLIKK
jgi:hypothetical protein